MVQRGLGSEVGTLMKKKELLGLPALRATKKILSLAMADKLMMRKRYYGLYSYEYQGYERGRYIRSRIFNGILKVSIFLPEHLRMGTKEPAFETRGMRIFHRCRLSPKTGIGGVEKSASRRTISSISTAEKARTQGTAPIVRRMFLSASRVTIRAEDVLAAGGPSPINP